MKITEINDYVDSVHEKFPELTREEVKRILDYGWKMVLQYLDAGNDIQIKTKDCFFFFGELTKDSLKNFRYYCYKLANRIKYMFHRTKAQWDGYFYFALTENQYQDYLKQSRRKYKVFKNVKVFKIFEQAKIATHDFPYMFRVDEQLEDKFVKRYPELRTKNAELIMQRDALKMQDVLTSQNKFKYLQ